METVSTLALLSGAVLMVVIAAHDARHFRISNKSVLALLALYLAAQGAIGFPGLREDLIAGGVLFGLGLVMWLLRGLGAGDAKLMLPLGLLLSMDGLVPFALLLMLVSVLFYLAMVLSRALGAQAGLGGWLAGLKTKGRVPYGVLLAGASIPPLLGKALLVS